MPLYPEWNDNDIVLLKKILTNLATLAEAEAGDVSSVNGRTGAVTLTLADVGLPTSSVKDRLVVYSNASGGQTSSSVVATTVALALPSTMTSGLQLYNTADQTTNYERFEALWSANVATLRSIAAGTGTLRSMNLSVGAVGFTLRSTGNGATTASLASISSAASSTNVGLALTPTYNQTSGTAANTDLLINRTETAVGSGLQYLIQAQVGGMDKFTVKSNGILYCSGALSADGPVNGLALRTTSISYSSGAWGTNGTRMIVGGGTVTDSSTAASGTAATAVFSSFAQPTLAATNASVTTTQAATVYIAGAPIAGTNQTINAARSLWIASGVVQFDGGIFAVRAIQVRPASGTESVGSGFSVSTNEGATARVDRTLPTTASGLTYTYVVQDADGIRVIAPAGSTIRLAGSVSSSGGTCTSTTIGDTITLVAINATQWVAIESLGAGWVLA